MVDLDKLERKRKPATIQEIKDALIKYKGMQYLAAESLDMTPQAISERIIKNDELRALRDSLMERRLDVAEFNLAEMTENKDLGAICFLLKTKGKHRGYTEKVDTKESSTSEVVDIVLEKAKSFDVGQVQSETSS